ncbi:hypothetical protein QBC39DRAFT_355405 [Podospora conica]|nr:hypothetical protein QBC39DRAFT_355405 [Schizothecium conicum]
MLDMRGDADSSDRHPHPVVYSRRRSPQVEWHDVTQPRRRSPSPDAGELNGEEAHGSDESPTTEPEAADPAEQQPDAMSADADDQGAGDAGGHDEHHTEKEPAVDETEAAAAGSSKDPEDSPDSHTETPQADTASPVVIDAHITIPVPAPSGVPDGMGSSGGSDSGRGEAPSSPSGADPRGDLVRKGLVDFFSKLAVDWGNRAGQSSGASSSEPASAFPGVTAALEVLRKLILDFIKLYKRLVRRFEEQTQALAGWAEEATLDALWMDMVKSFFCERSMGEEGFRDGAIMISSCQQSLQNAVDRAQEGSKGKGNDYGMERQVRVAKKCIVCCDGIVDLAKRAERERIACQQLITELKDVRDLLHKWMGKSRLWSPKDGGTDEQTGSRKQSREASRK